jgi:uncharacterized protein (DUF2141 family)
MAIRLPALLCALACCTCMSTGRAFAADLDVEVRGITVRKGEIRAALFDNGEDFAADVEVRAMITSGGQISAGVFTREEDFPRPPLRIAFAPANADKLRLRFTELEPGEYAVALFHDRNADGKLDALIDRRTLEPWGASNDPRPVDRAPTWEESRLTLPAEGKTIVIHLH